MEGLGVSRFASFKNGFFDIIVFDNIYKNQKILVTGHTGFKGSWLCQWLEILGAKVHGIALDPPTKPSHFELLNLNMDSRIFDIRDTERVQQAINELKPSIVFHLAAQSLVRDSYRLPVETYQTNVIGTANVLEACRNNASIKAVIVITSDKCYKNKESLWPFRETDPMGGNDPYSCSKGCAELVTASYRNSYFSVETFGKAHNTLVASCRAGNVIGGGDWSKDRLIPDLVRAADNGKAATLRNPQAVRPWQHVLDVLAGYLKLGQFLLKGEANFAHAWNFGPSQDEMVTVKEISERACKLWKKIDVHLSEDASDLLEAQTLRLDSTMARTYLSWKPSMNLDAVIDQTISWYKRFYDDQHVISREQIRQYQVESSNLGYI